MGAVTKTLARVVKADDAAGATLIGMVIYDYLADQAEALRDELNAVYGAWALDRLGVAKRQLGRTYVAKAVGGEYPDDSVHMAAEWLAGLEAYVVDAITVSKESAQFEDWASRIVRRDRRGRFARDIGAASEADVVSRNANAPGKIAPNVRPHVGNWDDLHRDFQQRLSTHQGQWEEAGDLLSRMASSFRGSEKDIEGVLTLQRQSGQIDEIVFPLAAMKDGQLPKAVGTRWDPSERGLQVSIQARRGASDAVVDRVAAFNALGEIGGSALQRFAEVNPERWTQFSDTLRMPSSEPDQTALTRFFNQLSAGGRVLSQVTGNDRMGRWAQFVGSMGPQAEEVLGPYVKRAAYRYRGTERTPDRGLINELKSGSPRLAAAAAANAKTLDGDSLKMQTRADVAAAYLATLLPKDPIIRRLSQAAGNVLPSQGVLFDADGDVVSQAVGYADDHYLPFDLKGLGRLRGGQYVRTRVMGGPTAEDIYASVHTGARMLTVVSPSGVFSLEFEPTFRGARASSDKARQMYDRYIKILDAVQESGLYLQDIDPGTRMLINRKARDLYPGEDKASQDMQATYVQRETNKARLDAMFVDPEQVEALSQEARRQVGAPQGDAAMKPAMARQYEDVLEDLIERERNKSVKKLKLNGDGYAVALQTLQQQFPYFLKPVRYMDYAQFRSQLVVGSGENRFGDRAAFGARFATDEGYVGPGGLRPASVRSGFYRYQGIDMKSKSKPESSTQVAVGGGGDKPAPKTPDTPDAKAPAKEQAERAPDAAVPPGGEWARMRQMSEVLDKRRDAAVGDLFKNIGAIPFNRRPGGEEVDGLTFADAAGTGPEDDATLARWFLSQSAQSIKDVLNSNSPEVYTRLLPVLQDTDVMESAFGNVMVTNGEGQDWFDSGMTIAGRSDMRGAMQWVADTARKIADLQYMKDPFVAVRNGEDRFYHQGPKPQGFEDLTSISGRDAFDEAVKNDPKLYAEMERLVVANGRAGSLGQVAARATRKVQALQDAKKVMPYLAAGDAEPFARAGVDAEDMHEALLLTDDEDVQDTLQGTNIDDEALRTQRAWTAYTVGRSFDPSLLGEGDAGPKGEAPSWSPLREVKKQQVSLEALFKAAGRI